MSEKPKLTPAQHAAAIGRSGENIALRSGAGCGKTFVLARRFTELLMRRGPSEDALDRFVALTFTEKAAMEMADRVRKTLYEMAQRGRGPSPDRRLLLKWIERLPEARIGTIHSFCAALLRAHAVEAEIDPDFEVCAEPMRMTQMRLTAAEETILQELEDDGSLAAEVLLAVPYQKALDLLLTLIETRTSWNAGDYDSPEKVLARWKQQAGVLMREFWAELAADPALRRAIDGIASLPCREPADRLAEHREEQLTLIGRMLASAEPPSAEQLGQLKGPGRLGGDKAWPGGAKEVRHRLKDLLARFEDFGSFAEPIGDLDERAAAQLAALTALAAKANARYAAAKRAEGILDFTDLLESAYRLLRDKPYIQRAVAAGIDQLLVDECQDTNALQVALLERLMFGREGGTELPAGRLFLVGDGKQSIYRFRGAQVKVFEDWCKRLGPAQREDLDVSFRTHPAGAGFVNHLFAPLMGEGYSPIHAKRTESPLGPSVEILLAGFEKASEKVNAEQATRGQAGVTARRIRQMVEQAERRVWDETTASWRPVRFGDIAVLFARMTDLGAYERELAAQEVPYYVLAGAGFFKQQEVYDLLGALRVVDNPFDDISFFGVLRSSLFGLDDESLLRIADTFRQPYLPALAEAMGAEGAHEGLVEMCGLDESAASTVAEACGLMTTLHRRKDALGIPRLLEGLLEKTGYEATLLGQVQGRQRVGNVRLL